MNAMSPKRSQILALTCALTGLLGGSGARASAEAVDRATRQALELDAQPKQGAQLFQAQCSRCHGSAAQGNAARAIPALAGQRFKYLVRQLANFAGEERESAPMHRVLMQKEMQRPQAWVDVAAYLNNLPATHRAETGDGTRVALGRGIFHEQCASCHRADAHGDADGFVPSLRNQHYSYLVNQLDKLADGWRHNVDEDLVLFWRSLEEKDVQATADYLSRLKGQGTPHKSLRQDGVAVD